MRILHIVRQFNPAVGGLENFVLCLARAQLQAGHEPVVLTLDTVFHTPGGSVLSAIDSVDGIAVRRVPWTGSYKYPLAFSAARQLTGFDIIHVHAIDFFADYLPLIRAFHKTPLVLSTHGGFFHSGYASRLKKVFFNTVTRWSVRGYRRVLACSEGDHAMFLPLCAPWLQLIENGVDIEKFAGKGAQHYANSLIFIGRFSSNKRLDLLLETVSHLKTMVSDLRLTIVGRDWDGNLTRIRQLIQQLDLAEHVNIVLDLDDDGIKELIGHHCFVVSASDYEGFGMTLVEGMAAGLVPLASPIKSFQRIVEAAHVGQLVDFHDPKAAAQSIFEYTTQIAADYPGARAAAQAAAARYGWPGTAARFMDVYEDVLGTRARLIQGVLINVRTGEEAIRAIDSAVEHRAGLRIAIANAHTVNLARNLPPFRALLRGFLVLNDGAGLNIASKWKYGKPFKENLNGTDFVPQLLRNSDRSLRVFLFGAQPAVVEVAFRRLADQYPRHQWVGYQDGYVKPAEESALCERIRLTTPDLLLVALGNPLQEEWIDRCAEKTGAAVSIGVGALFDFVAGKVHRAPIWVRRFRCEWLFRLVQEPGRMWRRYLIGNLTFLWAASRDRS